MPAVIASLTLTLIFWIGLKEREIDLPRRQGADAAADQIATTIKSDIDQQMNPLDRLARNGTDNPDTNLTAWQTDAAAALRRVEGARLRLDLAHRFRLKHEPLGLPDPGQRGARSASTRRWIAPAARGDRGGPHERTPRRSRFPPRRREEGNPGFVIFAPIGRIGSPNHFTAAEYLYARFFS